MENSFKLVVFFTLSFFIACSNNVIKKPVNAIEFKKFPVVQTLKEYDFIKIDTIKPFGLMLYKDTILLIRNSPNKAKYHFTTLNLKTHSFLTNYIESGYKTGQSLGFLSSGIMANYIWVFDLNKQEVIFSSLDSRSGKTIEIKESGLPLSYYSVQMIDDTTLIGSGDYDSDYKLAKYNLAKSTVQEQLVPYNYEGTKETAREDKMAYESFLFLKPTGNKCVLACRYADQIEVVDLDSRKSKLIKGPEGFEPDVMVMVGSDGKKLSARNADTRFAFVNGKVTDKYIYLLYSGNKEDSGHFNYGKYIYVYDWNGTPVKKIELKDYISDFVVTKDDNFIYTYNPVTKFLQTAKLTK